MNAQFFHTIILCFSMRLVFTPPTMTISYLIFFSQTSHQFFYPFRLNYWHHLKLFWENRRNWMSFIVPHQSYKPMFLCTPCLFLIILLALLTIFIMQLSQLSPFLLGSRRHSIMLYNFSLKISTSFEPHLFPATTTDIIAPFTETCKSVWLYVMSPFSFPLLSLLAFLTYYTYLTYLLYLLSCLIFMLSILTYYI